MTTVNRLAHMTTVEARAAADRDTIVVLPVGALEQHGPALPLGTDLIRAEALVERVAAELPDLVVVGPSVPVGVSPHHVAFAGTMTLRPTTFVLVLREYLDALAAHGWRRFLVVTGHGGNNAALGVLAQEVMHERPDLELAWAPVTALAPHAVGDMDRAEVTGHSGEAETAQMMHVAPDLVRTDQLDPLSRLARRTAPPTLAVPYDRLSSSGVLGDPRHATADQGRAILDEATRVVVDHLKEWADT